MRRLLVLLLGLAVVAAPLSVVADSAQAAKKPAAATFVRLDSDPGDAIGGGQTNIAFTSAKKTYVQGGRRDYTMWITVVDGDHVTYIFVEDQTKKPIRAGVHRFAGYPEGPYTLSIAGWGRGCGSSDGTLDIRQLEFDRDDRIKRLDLTFEMACTFDGSGYSRGQIAYQSTRSVSPPRTESTLRSGQALRGRRMLTNIEGVDGGTNRGEQAPRLLIRDGQALLLRREWPTSYNHPYTDEVVWSTPTAGSRADRLTVRADGALALQTRTGKTVWAVKPKGAGKGTFLVLNNDGRLVLADSRYKKLWSVG
ncbi:hypothetical protein JOF54_000230 [Microlunatus capsulatus]|uniref:Bulb-type lectin domain-containing protein n=1 Tax=Microlunatus capsulatus TaxID=99117 RepID=A0ABS4Z2P2_9ACTN|nr:hypothetical protein [Microlunatus capsulatus]MBP2415308.1 hypothetical protein [Microlunatus capsulatus]